VKPINAIRSAAARRLNMPRRNYDEQFNVLLGHTKATTTGIYGNVL
jgi:hypothetical protein